METMAMTPRLRAELLALAAFALPLCALAASGADQAGQFGADQFGQLGANQPLQYGVDIGVGESDNISLVPTNEVSQTIAIADGDLAIDQQTRTLDLRAKGVFSYLDFLQHAYKNELIGRFDGLGKLALLPGRLKWVLQDDFGQSQIDPFAATVPANRENINYVATGPDLTLRLGQNGFTDLSARYANTYYAVSPFDNDRLIGDAAVGLELSPLSRISLDASATRATFSNTLLNTNFTRDSGYAAYQLNDARTDLTVNAGATRVRQGNFTITGPLATLELSHKLTPRARLTLDGGRRLTDASTAFSNLQSGATGLVGNGNGTAIATQTTSNYTVTYGSLGWEYQWYRTNFNLTGRWERDNYVEANQFNRTTDGAEANIERRVTPNIRVQLLGGYFRTQYGNAAFTENNKLIGARVFARLGRALELTLRYDHVTRSAVGDGQHGYAENVVYLMLGYRPRTAATTSGEGF